MPFREYSLTASCKLVITELNMESDKIKVVILSNEQESDHELWIKACQNYPETLEYRVVRLTSDNWLREIQKQRFDCLLAKPGSLTCLFKQIYDERVHILSKVLRYPIYPSADEIFIYENKRYLSSWLQANRIPHPETHVFYDRKETLRHIDTAAFPIVGKTSIGASGSGVNLLSSKKEAFNYIDRAFLGRGAEARVGPNLAKGNWLARGMHYILNPGDINKKRNVYKAKKANRQIGYVILQEFIPHEFEWRVVRIGDSFFAHKKLKIKDKASGSLLKAYGDPPLTLLDFVKEITDTHAFFSQAVDVFESSRGYLVNEMQCIFGQSDPYQMIIQGEPGRFIWKNGNWAFEPGDFNGNECYNLRIEFVIRSFGIKKS
jgi:glutathione synthase/RimK-type ligase-like ATP-grasp enzyme